MIIRVSPTGSQCKNLRRETADNREIFRINRPHFSADINEYQNKTETEAKGSGYET
jgi:hypothetical protein